MQKGIFKIGPTCRGDGKIFIHIRINKSNECSNIKAESHVPDGGMTPALCLPFQEANTYIIELPLLETNQEVTLQAFSQSGSIDTTAFNVYPLTSSVKSKVHTIFRNQIVTRMRSLDKQTDRKPVAIVIASIIDGENDTDIVHAVITTKGTSDAFQENPNLYLIDSQGHNAALSDWVCIGDTICPHEDYPGEYTHKLMLSTRIDRSVSSFTLWVRFAGGNFDDAFICLESHTVQGHRDWWHNHTLSADCDPCYEKWFLNNHRASQEKIELQQKRSFNLEPKFSFIVLLRTASLNFFQDMVESVLNQTYRNLELILVYSMLDEAQLIESIERYISTDNRVKKIRVSQDSNIVECVLRGVETATGEFLIFLHPNDFIESDLLYRYIEGINTYPTTDLFYCDEDRFDGKHYYSAFFKPDWNPVLLQSQNYISHPLAVRKALIGNITLSPSDPNGSPCYDIALRVSEIARNIYHSRRILYHQRSGNNSAPNDNAQSTADVDKIALQNHLNRLGIHGKAEVGPMPNTYRVNFLITHEPLVSLIVPNKDMVDILKRFLDSVKAKTSYTNYEIIIIENNSSDYDTFSFYEKTQAENQRIRVITYSGEMEFNYSKIMNYGISQAKGDYVVLLNNDMEIITHDWIQGLLGYCTQDGIGAVGAKLLYPDNTIQHAGVLFERYGPIHEKYCLPDNTLSYYGNAQIARACSAVTGACMMVNRQLFNDMGGLDETLAVDFNDIDFCLRMRRDRGLLTVYQPDVVLYHFESMSRGTHETLSKRTRYCKDIGIMHQKWPTYYTIGDWYGNPNFASGENSYHHLNLEKNDNL